MKTLLWTDGGVRYAFATLAHIPAIADMLTDAEVGRWLWFTPAPREVFEGFFTPLIEAQVEALRDDRWPTTAVFVVEDASSGAYLGQGAVVAVEGSPGGCEIGFQLPQSSWGRGIGTRLGRFLCAYAVGCCDAFRIEGTCLAGNVASQAILRGLGLQLESTRPGYRLREGERHTEVSYGALVSTMDEAEIRAHAASLGIC